jgi:superfamily II DNA/RNA helicase
MLALLNKPRVSKFDRAQTDSGGKPPLNSIVIVPHRDLAYQLLHWIDRINAIMPPSPFHSISSVATVLVRSHDDSVTAQVARLHSDPPHILIATPNALADVFQEDIAALQLDRVSSVVIDEVDALIDSIPSSKSQFEQRKFLQKQRRHPPVTLQILEHVFTHRLAGDTAVDVERRTGSTKLRRSRPLQLIMTSATFRHHLHQKLFQQSGLLTREEGHLVKINGNSRSKVPELEDSGGGGITHCVLVVSHDGGVRNIDGSVTLTNGSATLAVDERLGESILRTPTSHDIPPHDLSEQQFESKHN